MNTCAVRSYCKHPKQGFIVSPFKIQAIMTVGQAVRQRLLLIRIGKSHLAMTDNHRQVIRQYEIYKDTWTTRGIALFLLRYGNELRELVPSSNPPALKTLNDLIDKAPEYINQ